MILQMIRAKRRQVLIDVNTQRDFMLADGSACIRNHRRVLVHIRRMMAWARRRDVPIISTCEVYPDGNGHNGNPQYCIDGTIGQAKIPYTLVPSRICFPADGRVPICRATCCGVTSRWFCTSGAWIRSTSLGSTGCSSEVCAAEFVLIGASAEGAVKAAALGLLQRDKRVARGG